MNGIQTTRPLSRKRNPLHINKHFQQQKIQRFKSEQNLRFSEEAILDQDRNEMQLMKEIQLAKIVLDNYKNPLPHKKNMKDVGYGQNGLDYVKMLENVIAAKDQQLKQINQEIKILRSAPDQIRKDAVKKYKTFRQAQMFKLADEVGNLREDLMFLQRIHQKKKTQLEAQKEKMDDAQHKYFEICSVLGKTVLSFQEFRTRKRQKQKSDGVSKIKKHFKKPFSIQKNKQYTQNTAKNVVLMDLKEAINKLQIAESALKNFRKKHNSQKAQLNGKLDFLKEENQELEEKLKIKNFQLNSAQMRFTEVQKITPKRKIKIKRYSQPQM